MDRAYLKFSVDGQIITRTDNLSVVGDTQNYHFAEFRFSKEWDGLRQTAVFRANGVKPIGVEIRNGQCEVPWEVLMRTEFFVGVFAGERITTNTVRVPVGTPVSTNSVPGVQPTPSAYEMLVKRTEEALSKAPTIKENGNWWVWDDASEAYVDSGVYAGGSAPYIGPAGTWIVGDADTGVIARGPRGETGAGIEVEYEEKTGTVKVKNLGGSGNNPGTGADITGDLIIEKLGYTPANEEDLDKKVSLPESGNGTDGQYAVSDGAGGIRWKTGGGGSFDGEITADAIEEALGYAPAKPINVFSVKNFGTKADGATDDSGAIQTAVDACNEAGGGTVYFPEGTYLLNTGITVYSNMKLLGEPGAKLLRNSDTNKGSVVVANDAENVIVENLAFDGGTKIADTSYIIELTNVTHCRVDDCSFVVDGSITKSTAAISIVGGYDLTVDRCSFNMNGIGYGVHTKCVGVTSKGGCDRVYVTHCYFENTGICFGGKETTDMFFGYNKIKNCYAGAFGTGTANVYIGRACHNIMDADSGSSEASTNVYTYKTVYGFGNLANGKSYVRDSGDDNKLSLPKNTNGQPVKGTKGQYAVSDGSGGLTWKTEEPIDVDELVNSVLDALPTWTGGSY